MKIGYLVNQYPAPSHTFIRREIRALEKLGIPIERYSVRESRATLVDAQDLAEKEITHGILTSGARGMLATSVLYAIRHPARFGAGLRLCLRLAKNSARGLPIQFAYLMEACTLLRLAKNHGVTHLHAHFGTNSTTVAMLCHRLGGPGYSFMAHGPDEFDAPMDMSLGLKIEDARFVAAISDFARSQLFRWCGWNHWKKIHIVPCGIDERFVEEAPPAVPPSKRFFWAGRLSEEKGLPILLEACRLLHEEGLEFEVLMAGAGHLKETLQEKIGSHGLERTMTFAGWLDDAGIREALEGSIALIIPSFSEGLPVILMEAMARARPAIATRIAAIPELLIDKQHGWIVAPGSVKELSDAMREALATPSENLSKMGLAARERVLGRHDVNQSARILSDLFKG